LKTGADLPKRAALVGGDLAKIAMLVQRQNRRKASIPAGI
jgi:hypothetical protein